MRNLFDLVGYGLNAKQGFYILTRVREHVLFTEPWDEGWGNADDELRTIWVRDFNVEYTAAEQVAA